MKRLTIGKWSIGACGLLTKDGSKSFADLYEGFDAKKSAPEKLVKEIFAYCFHKKDCSPQDIEDLHHLMEAFILRERMIDEFQSLERRVRRELYPNEVKPKILDLAVSIGDPFTRHDVKVFGGKDEARRALAEVRRAALERWEHERGYPFPHEDHLLDIEDVKAG